MVETLDVCEVEALETWVRGAPTSAYARRAWFLYEMLTARTLDVEPAGAGSYVPLLGGDRYYTAAPVRSRRHRVLDDRFGGRDFCPIVRRTPELERLQGRDLRARLERTLRPYDPGTLARVVSYLYTKETRSSFEIERERPTTDPVRRFVAVLRRAHDWPELSHDDLVRLQNQIVADARNRDADYRTTQNYVARGGTREVDFVAPRPGDLPPMMAEWLAMVPRLVRSDVDAVVAAAATAFAFVYLHPFEDGNGRIHRFLVHYVLARKGFTPPGALVPVAATMLARMQEYDAALERFSTPLMARLRYEVDADGVLDVLHDSAGYYRYPDLTGQAEVLYGWVAASIEEDVPRELAFMLAYRDARRSIAEIVELPDRKAELFVARCIDNGGRLPKRLRRGEFDTLRDAEVAAMEAAVQDAMTAHGIEVER